LMAAHNLTPAECFGTIATMEASSSTKASTRRFFTVDENINNESFYNPLLSNGYNTRSRSAATDNFDTPSRLPSWLRLRKSHLMHENMERLRGAMRNSFFTENEVLKLNYAIQEAANGDAQRMAGAAEFCHIMVETMEMGLNALIAAAFHYTHCVVARQQSTALPHRDLSPWDDAKRQAGIASFGEHPLQIEKDAARLKRLEMVASMVYSNNSHRVTPDEQEADNLRNLFLTEAKDWRALAIRGAACLYRLRGILEAQKQSHERRITRETGQVCREALRIYAPIASRMGMHRLKNELEEAAFRILYPRQFHTVSALLHQTRDTQNLHLARREYRLKIHNDLDIGESMNQILGEVQAEMTELLENDPVFSHSVEDFKVTARVKESYSTWKKMLRNRFDHILQVPDALALRIVLNSKKENPDESDGVTRARERALCYYAQKVCQNRWAPLPDAPRFKDYIANPKPNGYQSLHYTALTEWHGEEWSMEIQVRSGEMHKVAEYGVASHWDYKTRGKPIKQFGEQSMAASIPSNGFRVTINEHYGNIPGHHSDAYLRGLQEWHWERHGGAFESDAGPSSVEPLILSDEAEHKVRMERIRARTQRLAPYIEALTEAQSDLARENVFVFIHQSEKDIEGTVLALPAGSVVLDAIRYCELPSISEHLITHNGVTASLTQKLVNGDVLSLPSLTPTVTSSI